jgi:hypothetical protein
VPSVFPPKVSLVEAGSAYGNQGEVAFGKSLLAQPSAPRPSGPLGLRPGVGQLQLHTYAAAGLRRQVWGKTMEPQARGPMRLEGQGEG